MSNADTFAGIKTKGPRGIIFETKCDAKWAYVFGKLHYKWRYKPKMQRGYVPTFLITIKAKQYWVEVKADNNIFEKYQSKLDRIKEAEWEGPYLILGSKIENHRIVAEWINMGITGSKTVKPSICIIRKNCKNKWVFQREALVEKMLCKRYTLEDIDTLEDSATEFRQIWIECGKLGSSPEMENLKEINEDSIDESEDENFSDESEDENAIICINNVTTTSPSIEFCIPRTQVCQQFNQMMANDKRMNTSVTGYDAYVKENYPTQNAYDTYWVAGDDYYYVMSDVHKMDLNLSFYYNVAPPNIAEIEKKIAEIEIIRLKAAHQKQLDKVNAERRLAEEETRKHNLEKLQREEKTARDAQIKNSVSKTPEPADNENECIICFDAKSDSYFIPCGHLICCQECSLRVEICPKCRSLIKEKRKVYR